MNASLPRRGFLLYSLALTQSLRAAKHAKPSHKFPTDVRHRLSVSTYPFRTVIASPHRPVPAGSQAKMTLHQFAATIPEKFKVYGIEPWSAHFESIEPQYIADLAAGFKKAQVHVVNIPCDVRVKLCGTPDERAEALSTYKKWVDAAKLLGSPSIRVHCPAGVTPEDTDCAIEGLKSLAEYAATQNMVIDLENDSPSNESPERIVKVVTGANTLFLRALPDFCNSMQIHDDQEYNSKALESLFPLAYNISHVKDVEIVRGKTLKVDVDQIFEIAKKSGYRGYFSMETEGSLDPYEGTKNLIDAAVKSLS